MTNYAENIQIWYSPGTIWGEVRWDWCDWDGRYNFAYGELTVWEH